MLSNRDIVHCALFAAIVAALGLVPPIPLGFIPAPITAQTLGVMLAGAILGAWRGGLALLVFVILILAGLPLLSGGRGGIGVLFGPTGGFLAAWPLAAFVTGLLAERLARGGNVFVLFACCVIGGIAVIYAVGIPWMSLTAAVPLEKAFYGSMAFIPGDLIKAGLAAFVAATVRRAYPAVLVR